MIFDRRAEALRLRACSLLSGANVNRKLGGAIPEDNNRYVPYPSPTLDERVGHPPRVPPIHGYSFSIATRRFSTLSRTRVLLGGLERLINFPTNVAVIFFPTVPIFPRRRMASSKALNP